ncbi:MAG: aminotransferase class I/II-fold pyridoxal phosphate-dependent enzyme [bacterium]
MQKLVPDKIHPRISDLANDIATEEDVIIAHQNLDKVVRTNQLRVLNIYREARVSDMDFSTTTGYGYDDGGRDKLERIFAATFGAEAALVRPQIVSGTHALALCLYGTLFPGDELVAVTGRPYDTLANIILGDGTNRAGFLVDQGVKYKEVPWPEDTPLDFKAIEAALSPQTRAVLIQRSRGYSLRPPLSVGQIKQLIQLVKSVNESIVTIVDNCYGEFVETKEPAAVGADLVAGSLIKNPGGGLAPGGGYVAGKKELVALAASRLIAPGLGLECGPNLGLNRLLYQGLYMAPLIVGEALHGAIFTSRLFELLGFRVFPKPTAMRHDLVQAISLGDAEKVRVFCQAIQMASPVNSYVSPEAAAMPGYDVPVIMAAGAFVQGSSIELSADAPMRPPFTVFLQGGLNRHQVKFSAMLAAQALMKQGLL